MTMLLRLTPAAVVLAFASALLLLASGRAAAPDALITHLTAQNVSEVLVAMGATDIKVEKDEQGEELLAFKINGGPVLFSLTECGGVGRCTDLQMAIFFAKESAYTPQLVNSFNAKWLDATAAIASDGTLMLVDLFIVNGGVTKENMRANFAVFLNAPGVLVNHMRSLQQVAHAPGGAPGTPTARRLYLPPRTGVRPSLLREYFGR